MSEDNDQEKTESATSRRLDDAREKGQVPRSRDLVTLMVVMSGLVMLYSFGQQMNGIMLHSLADSLTLQREQIFRDTFMLEALHAGAVVLLQVVLPFAGVLAVAAVAGSIMLGGWMFSVDAYTPKFERMDPLAGLQRIWSWQGLVELVKSIVKLLFLGVLAWRLFIHALPDFISLGTAEPMQAIAEAGFFILLLLIMLAAGQVLIVLIDVPFQLWHHAHGLRMSRQEVRDEYKETEGKPEIKGKIRRLQRELTNNRMLSEVARADVVIMNPEHYAVALLYDRDKHAAPVLVAKGVDMVAMQIRQRAISAGVPIVTAPPLARAIHASTRLNHTVPSGLFQAVARILAYVYQLRNAGADRPSVPREDELIIPEELRK